MVHDISMFDSSNNIVELGFSEIAEVVGGAAPVQYLNVIAQDNSSTTNAIGSIASKFVNILVKSVSFFKPVA